MRRPASTWRTLLVSGTIAAVGAAMVVAALTGCSPTQPFYLHEDGDLSHYIDRATQVEIPDLNEHPLAEVEHSRRPLSLSNPQFQEFWDLTLEECVAITLANTKVIRGGQAIRLQNGQIFAGTQHGNLVEQTQLFSTIYNPAIVESNPGFSQFNLFGQPTIEGPSVEGGQANIRQGVEAALADFDAQLTVAGDPGSIVASSTDRPLRPTPLQEPQIIDRRQGGLNVGLSKRTAEGTQFFVRSTTNYDRLNRQDIGIPSIWTQELEVEARHPLLRGRGAQINRMQIILARIGSDIEISGLLNDVHELLSNVEVRYWDLYLAYRNLETAKVSRDSALETWRIVYSKFAGEVIGKQEESQAREQYFNFRAAVESALRNLFDAENELRLLMGLAATDGRLIRPKDDPSLARMEFDWNEILAEAVARRPELMQQRWEIKQREMELILARNRLLPQLDVGAFYRWVGVGDDLIEADRNGIGFQDPVPGEPPGTGSTAWEELTGGRFQEFGLLFQYQMPIGFRRELAGVRHAQLRLTRDKAVLEDMELDISHSLSHAIRNLDTNYQLAQTNANRWAAAQDEVRVAEDLFRGGKTTLDIALEAQRRRAVAQGAFWLSVVEYNKAIVDVHAKKGSIMEYDGVGFAEGQWPQKAYWDALGHARERDAGWYIDYGWTRPKVISRGPMPQTSAEAVGVPEAMPGETTLEEVPSPEPTPARPPAARDAGPAAPGTQPVPQEIRRGPDLQKMEPVSGLNRSTSESGSVRPVGFFPRVANDGNPLRSGNARPIGTGVAE